MNTTTDLETPTPVEEIKQVDKPRYNVPILIEITEEDRQKADLYSNPSRCLVATSLKRNGYAPQPINIGGTHGFEINGQNYLSEDINQLNAGIAKRPFYKPEVVGKQIILYPV